MRSLWRKFTWWRQRRRKEDELREELQFHLAEEASDRQADGLAEDQARWAARRDLGNVTRLQENTRALWSWILLEQLAQDIRYGLRSMVKNRMFTALAALSLALGIGANTAIYSFMDSILLRSLPVSDPASLVVVKWQSKPINFGGERVRPALHRRQHLPQPFGRHRGHLPIPGVRAAAGSIGAGPVEPLRAQAGRPRECDDQGRGGARAGRVRLRRLLSRTRGRARGGPPDLCRRRWRRRGAGRGPELRLQRAALRQRGRRDRTADSRQQRAVQRHRRRAGGVLRCRPGRRAEGLSPHARQLPLRPSCGKEVRRPELLLGRDDGPAASRR